MKKKNNISTIFLVLILIVGLSLLLYPTISDYWNSFNATRAITSYSENVSKLDNDEYEEMLNSAKEYNRRLAENFNGFFLDDNQQNEYNKLLDISATGIMGYVEIPSIRCTLPIYHGTDESALQVAIGHLEWTSLPVGGESTHAVISGHRGLPSAKLFTDIDRLVENDVFVLRVLDEVMVYQVDQILIVEPDDTSALKIEEGKDLCTLVTCTPYGVNSHRLLVRGHRIQTTSDYMGITLTSDAIQIDPNIVASFIALPILGLLLIRVFIPKKKK
ncbi:MAG: class C sortase [Firmicutes bacterium]|nr:class C sortase [Bacillota bacterium]